MSTGDQSTYHTIAWGNITPFSKAFQIYKDDTSLLKSLYDFTVDGIDKDETIILIATRDHLDLLEHMLRSEGQDVFGLTLRDQYIPLNVEEAMSRFLIDGQPDELLFEYFITTVLTRVHHHSRKVRVFGEMSQVLWQRENDGSAVVHLEMLWNRFSMKNDFQCYCAFPVKGFNAEINKLMLDILGFQNNAMINWNEPSTHVQVSSPRKQTA